MGSGCGAVGRAVAYDTRRPRFESSHRQLLLNIYLLLTVCRKDENKEKRPGLAHLFKKKNYVKQDLFQAASRRYEDLILVFPFKTHRYNQTKKNN